MKDRIKTQYPLVYKYLRKAESLICRYLYNLYNKRGYFLFQGKSIKYFAHPYNTAGLNERSIEVPLIYNLVKKYRGKEILEIGNVLSHYFNRNWDVVDKYEEEAGVINEDAIDFKPQNRYNLIVSISTFEHIRHDEANKDNNKVVTTIGYVKSRLLAAGGLFVMTIPLGYNANIDKKLFAEEMGFKKIYYFRRISVDNKWQECRKEDVINAEYNLPFKWANAIAICATEALDFLS